MTTTLYSFTGMKCILVVTWVAAVTSAPVGYCEFGSTPYPQCKRDWHVGLDHVRPSGTVVHGHVNTPESSGVQASAHGTRVFGGPYSGASTVGGGVNYQHPGGLHGGVDVTHTRGQGNVVTGAVGGSTKVGPGTLTVHGAASTVPHSSHVQGSVGATYSVPLP